MTPLLLGAVESYLTFRDIAEIIGLLFALVGFAVMADKRFLPRELAEQMKGAADKEHEVFRKELGRIEIDVAKVEARLGVIETQIPLIQAATHEIENVRRSLHEIRNDIHALATDRALTKKGRTSPREEA